MTLKQSEGTAYKLGYWYTLNKDSVQNITSNHGRSVKCIVVEGRLKVESICDEDKTVTGLLIGRVFCLDPIEQDEHFVTR